MPDVALLALGLVVTGVAVLAPLWRPARRREAAADDERERAQLRHRVAIEALRDLEADRRAGSLDEAAYAAQLADAEARAAETRIALDGVAVAPAAPSESLRRPALVAAAAIGGLLLAGWVVPATGIANHTVTNEALARAQVAEEARQDRIRQLTAAIATDPTDAASLSDLADAYLAGSTEQDLVAAASALQLLIALEPDRADAYERIISAYLRAGDAVNARAALTSYAELPTADPVEVAFLDGLIALRAENDRQAAVAAFDRFLELAPGDERAAMVGRLRDEAADSP